MSTARRRGEARKPCGSSSHPSRLSHGVRVDEVMKVVGIKHLLRDAVDALVEQPFECRASSASAVSASSPMRRAEAAIGIRKQRTDRPVAVVRMREPLASVLQLRDRRQRRRARIDSSKGTACNAWEVDDRCAVRKTSVDRAGHDTADPVRRATPALRDRTPRATTSGRRSAIRSMTGSHCALSSGHSSATGGTRALTL